MMVDRTLIILLLVLLMVDMHSSMSDTHARGYADPHPVPWDWQNAPSNYPVFNSFPTNKANQPQFLHSEKNISIELGETANLPCSVKNLGKHTVSWMQPSAMAVISAGHLVFSSDLRLSVKQVASAWVLSMENTTKQDEGLYECQVNTEPKINKQIFLSVKENPRKQESGATKNGIKTHLGKKYRHEPKVIIPGGSIQYATSGSGVGLECLVSGLRNPPLSLYWEKGNKVVTAKERPGVSLETEKLAGVSRIRLYIGSTVLADTGNYTCVSDTAKTETVLLVVTLGNDGQVPEGLKIGQNGDCRRDADKEVIVMFMVVGFMVG